MKPFSCIYVCMGCFLISYVLRKPDDKAGFVQLLHEVLERPWYLIWTSRVLEKPLKKEDFAENCLKTRWSFAWVKIVEIASC